MNAHEIESLKRPMSIITSDYVNFNYMAKVSRNSVNNNIETVNSSSQVKFSLDSSDADSSTLDDNFSFENNENRILIDDEMDRTLDENTINSSFLSSDYSSSATHLSFSNQINFIDTKNLLNSNPNKATTTAATPTNMIMNPNFSLLNSYCHSMPQLYNHHNNHQPLHNSNPAPQPRFQINHLQPNHLNPPQHQNMQFVNNYYQNNQNTNNNNNNNLINHVNSYANNLNHMSVNPSHTINYLIQPVMQQPQPQKMSNNSSSESNCSSLCSTSASSPNKESKFISLTNFILIKKKYRFY
jgi:hypothetical protein